MPERAAEKDVIRARTAIGQLLGDKIRLLPTADGYLEAEVIGNYGGL